MARLITIEVTGQAGNYEAMVRKIQEQNSKLYAGVQQGAAQAAGSVKMYETALNGLSSVFGGLGAAALAFKAINFLESFTAWVEQLRAVSIRTKIAIEDLNALERTVKQEEGSFTDLTTGLRRLAVSMGDARDPTSTQAKLFKQLGIDISEGVLPAFFQLADRMKNNLTTVDQYNIAFKLLGRSSEELINFMLLGGDAIKQRMEEEKKAGVITKEFADRVDDARDKWERFKGIISVKIGQPVVESLLDIGNGLDILGPKINLFGEKLKAIFFQDWDRYRQLRAQGEAADKKFFDDQTTAAAKRLDALSAGLDERLAGTTDQPKKLITIIDDKAAKAALELVNKQQEALAKLQTEEYKAAVASETLKRTQGDMSDNLRIVTFAMIDQETQTQLLAAAHDKLGPAVADAIIKMGELKKENFENAEIERERKLRIEGITAALEAQAKVQAIQAEADAATKKFYEDQIAREREEVDVRKTLGESQADYLQIIGRTNEAEAVRLQAQVQYLENMKKFETDTAKLAVIDQQVLNAQTALSRIGRISVDIGTHVGNTLNDIFTALITGTLKSVDIGKAALATVGRIGSDIFSQIIKDKLTFELKLFTNLRQLPGQANSAILSGGGGGGLLQTLLFGGGSAVLQGVGANLPSMGGVPAGGTTYPGTGGGGGFGGGGGLVGTAISTTTSFLQNTELGIKVAAFLTELAATVSKTITTMLTYVSTTLAKIPGYGWIAAAVIAAISIIYRIIANQQERPNVKLSGEFGGVAFDPATQQFIPGEINVGIGRKVGIKNSQAGAIATNLQQRLIILSNQWTDILNIFPDFLAKDIIPALDETNERLRYNFSNLKFSPAGRSIAQELEAMSGPNGLVRMLNAFLPALSAGFTGALGAAGIPSAGMAGFGNLTPTPYWEFPKEDWDKFIQALKDTATLTGSLASTGASKFLAPADLATMGSIFDALFAQTDVKAFTEMAGQLQEQLKPVTDFLTSSVQEATNLFGRGLTAAMDAATESDARLGFLNSLNAGIKDVVFKGLSDAFIASAQFGDLLAPIQQQIRIFATQALTTGETPDIAAFRTAILPAIQAISTRADLLGPLIDALQELGFNIKELLGLNPAPAEAPAEAPAASTPVGPQVTNIYVQGAGDPEQVAREIEKILRGTVPPTT